MKYLARLPEEPLHFHVGQVSKLMEEMVASNNVPVDIDVVKFIGLFHDIGKYTRYFQNHLVYGDRFGGKEHHAFISSLIIFQFIEHFLVKNSKIVTSAHLAVRHHHSNLSDVETEFNATDPSWYLNAKHVKEQIGSILEAEDEIKQFYPQGTIEVIKQLKEEEVVEGIREKLEDTIIFNNDNSLYFNTNLLLGMLVDADIRAVIGLSANESRSNKVPYIPDNVVDEYLKGLPTLFFTINKIRSEFYTRVVENIKSFAQDSKILSITAPTGIGKTLAGFSAAVKWRNIISNKEGCIPRIIYVLPYTSIIDQNYKVICNVLEKAGIERGLVIKHHYRTSAIQNNKRINDVWGMLEEDSIISERLEKVVDNYEQAHTCMETWDAEIVVTTFVRFFETIFTYRRSEMRRLHRLVGSIVIFDEVQNIPACYLEVTENLLRYLCDKFNTRFLLMTATKPSLFENVPELTEPKKQFFFKKMSRTCVEVDLKEFPYNEIDLWLLPKIGSARNFMVILNTIRCAQDVYYGLKEYFDDVTLYFLSASLIPIHREKVIEEIKEKLESGVKVGLVCTQVIEAGVDIDFDVVIRDLAPLDSIVQAAGRCNRSGINELGRVFLVRLIDDRSKDLSHYIYDSVLLDVSLKKLKDREIFDESEYIHLVEEYFKEIRDKKTQEDSVSKAIEQLKYDEINFNLIKGYIPHVPVFVEFDKRASEIIKRLEGLESIRVNTYNERMRRRRIFKLLEYEIWQYVVNVPVKIVIELGLGHLPYAKSILWLSKDGYMDFDQIYNKEVGFCRSIEHRAIFL